MVSVVRTDQILNSISQIRQKNPNWSDEQVLDYFRFKNDVLNIAEQTDLTTGEIEDLEARVTQNEQDIDANETNISSNESRITQNENDIAQNENDIAQNASDISQNVSDIAQNAADISTNENDILNLEHRALGDGRPVAYSETTGYLANDYVVYPVSDPQNYYIARQDIPSPAGVFDPSKWFEVSLKNILQGSRDTFVTAGYGGIGLNAASAIGTIDATWQTLIGWDVALINDPLDVTQDFASNGIRIQKLGIWQGTVKVALAFDEVNAGRIIKLRAYNGTTATPGNDEFIFFVGRNQGGVNMNVTLAVDVDGTTTSVNDLIQFQVAKEASSANFTNASNIGSVLQTIHVSERKEQF